MSGAAVRTAYRLNVNKTKLYRLAKRYYPEIGPMKAAAFIKGRTRLGCWFCHCQRIGELKRLYYDYPQLWDKLAALDIESPTMFKPDGRLSYYAGRFSREGQQTTLFSEEGGP